MTKWSLLAELMSLSMLLLMFLYYHERKTAFSFRRRVFYWIFGLSISSILVNIVCVYTIAHYDRVPVALNQLLNTLYFILVLLVSSTIALYIFDLILEHVYRKDCYKKAVIGIAVLTAAYLIIALTNVWTGALFYFTEDGHYARGPLNRLGYVILGLELVMVLLCYFRNRAAIPQKVVRVIHTLPPVVAALACFQFFYPEILFNGTITTVVAFILYSNFQTCQVEEDYLTHLGNRKAFISDITLKIRSEQPFQIVSVSVRHFSEINQKFDHAFGDDLLFNIGKWLEGLPGHYRTYRYSGVSFAVIFPYQDAAEAEVRVQEIHQRFSQPWYCKNIPCKLTVCTCDVVWNGQLWTSNTVMEYLEIMVEMSKAGGNPLIRFNNAIAVSIEREKYLEAVLRSSLKGDRFTIVLQPLFNCRRRMFCCGEALVRLNDYDGTPIPAGEFIPIAEKVGLIDEISWVVLDRVCRFLANHRDLPLESVSINLSMQQFQDPSLLPRIEACLQRYSVPRGKLKIEITERVISQDLAYVREIMEQLSRHGIGFYLDDFGTGYSNFSVVMRLPFECIKLDRSLLSQLIENQNSKEIVRDIISLFHNSGFRVACEGIETAAQSDIVTALGTDLIQGFYHARPMEPEAFAEFISGYRPQP